MVRSHPVFHSDESNLHDKEIFASTSEWLENLSFNSLGAALPLGDRGTVLGIGTTLLYSGGLKGYDESLKVVSEESYYNLGLDVTLGHRFGGTGLPAAMGVQDRKNSRSKYGAKRPKS